MRRTKGFKLLFNYVDRDIRHCAHTYTYLRIQSTDPEVQWERKKKALLRLSDTRRICLLPSWIYLTADAIDDGLILV